MAKKPNGNGGSQLATREPSVALMLQGVIERGITSENVAALEQLVGLYERMQTKDAERAYNQAFNKLQSELPKVEATKPVPNRDGTIRYTYATFEAIMDKVQPTLTANGFSVSFNSRAEADRIVSICTLRHIGGHSQSNEFAVRIGSGPPSATVTQADGAAKTYAKRGALADALNIVIETDDDARMLGRPIGKALAESLKDRCQKLGINTERFLAFAGAVDFESISDTRYEFLDEELTKREKGQKLFYKKANGPEEKKDPKTGEYLF